MEVDVWIRITRTVGDDSYNHLVRVAVDDEELPWLERGRHPQLPLLDLAATMGSASRRGSDPASRTTS